MRTFLKIFVALICLFLLVAVGGAWWVQSKIKDPEFIEGIRQKVVEASRVDIRFEKLDFEIFKGVVITKLLVQSLPEDGWKSQLAIDEVHLGYKWKDLLDKKITIDQIKVIHPQIELWKDGKDEWDFKNVLVGAQAASEISDNIKTKEFSVKVQFNVDQLLVKDARIEGFFHDGTSLFRCEGTDIKGKTQTVNSGFQANGTMIVGRLLLLGAYEATNIVTPFSVNDNKVDLNDIRGEFYDGRLTGKTNLNLGVQPQTFAVNLDLEDVSLESYQRAKGKDPVVTGALKADITLNGNLAEPKQAQGNGSFSVGEMKVSKIKNLDVYLALINMGELLNQSFAQTSGTYKVENQQITFYKIEGTSPAVQLTGSGTLGFDQAINMDCMLAIAPALSQKIPASFKTQLQQREDGYSTLVFKVYGTTADPKTNLMEKVGGDLLKKEVVTPLFNKLFKRDKKNEEQAPAPTDAPPLNEETVAPPAQEPTPSSTPVPHPSAETVPPAQAAESVSKPESSEELSSQPYQPGE